MDGTRPDTSQLGLLRRSSFGYEGWTARSGSVSKNGQFLVEAAVAISILVVGFLGMFTLLSRSFYLSRVVTDNYTATYLAAEGIEVVKNLIDANVIQKKAWDFGITDGTYEVSYDTKVLGPDQDRFLSFDTNTNLYGYSGGAQTNFKRKVKITHQEVGGVEDEIQVISTVTWSTGLAQSSIRLEDHFFNWRAP